jgi:virulence-associated protein E/bifunctional DNA primase/polymerase-like protein
VDIIYNEARRLHVLGFSIIWLHPKSKRPWGNAWTSGDRRPWSELKSTYQKGMNVGVRTGSTSKLENGYLACIDLDIKSGTPDSISRARKLVRDLIGDAKVCIVRSGRHNGSSHYYVVTPTPFKMITVHKDSDFEICIYSDGRQMVLPPSVHPDTGKLYEWESKLSGVLPLLDFSHLKSVKTEKPKSSKSPGKPASASSDFVLSEVDIAWLPMSETIREGILHGRKVTDRSSFLLPACNALLSAGLNENQVLSVLTDPDSFLGRVGYDHTKSEDRAKAAEWVKRYSLDKVASQRDPKRIYGKIKDPEPIMIPEDEIKEWEELLLGTDWREELDRGQKGKLTTTFRNLNLIFKHEIEDGILYYEDLFASRVCYGVDTPWGGKSGEYIKDIDMIMTKGWFADSVYRIEPNTSAILEVTSFMAHKCAVHPVKDYLLSLKWDGKPRIDTWLKDYCKAEAPEPYLSEVSRKFLLAMVRRIFEPGCQWDYILILEGNQGIFKSTVARTLASDKWFMDNLPDLKDKDAMLNLSGKWLIELGELANVKRSDYNLVKAYLTRRVDTVRPHYGRLVADVPRQSCFIGTVNEGQYLKDPTGNRRYWPVKVGIADIEGLKAVRDQLFAEAYHIYKTTGEKLMLSNEGHTQATEAQEDRRVDDDETDMREEFIAFKESQESADFDFDKFRIAELFEGPNAPWGKFSGKPYSNQTGSTVLQRLGYIRRKLHGLSVWGLAKNDGKRNKITDTLKEQKSEKKGGGGVGEDPQGLPPPIEEIDFM